MELPADSAGNRWMAGRNSSYLCAGWGMACGMCFVMLGKKVTWKGAGISVLLLGVIFAVRMPWVSAYLLTLVAGLGLFLPHESAGSGEPCGARALCDEIRRNQSVCRENTDRGSGASPHCIAF